MLIFGSKKLFGFITLIYLTNAMFIRTINDNKKLLTNSKDSNENDWSMFQKKLGLTDQKVDLLKAQNDQEGTKELLKRFIKENPKYVTANSEPQAQTQPKFTYSSFINGILKQLKKSKSVFKTSLNFELADKSNTNWKRPRRKINVRMTSDMPTDKIDELLQLFNKKHGIESDTEPQEDDDLVYNDISSLTTANENDFAFGNLYEDEEDLSPPTHNTEFGSFQDLFLQAKRSQWEKEIEETKLLNQKKLNFL